MLVYQRVKLAAISCCETLGDTRLQPSGLKQGLGAMPRSNVQGSQEFRVVNAIITWSGDGAP